MGRLVVVPGSDECDKCVTLTRVARVAGYGKGRWDACPDQSHTRALAPVCRLTESFWEVDDGSWKGYGHRWTKDKLGLGHLNIRLK